MSAKPWCCFIPCDKDAEWEIVDGPSTDDYTQACSDHVGHLLQDGRVAMVYEVPALNAVTLAAITE